MPLEGLPVKRTTIRTRVATLSYYSLVAESLWALNCRGCRSPLDIHQPNPNQPDHFLATCANCGRWYRVESRGKGGRITLLQLPDLSELEGPAPDQDHKP
jgi:hypothetical protein